MAVSASAACACLGIWYTAVLEASMLSDGYTASPALAVPNLPLQVLRLGNIVPDFEARTTMGDMHWHDMHMHWQATSLRSVVAAALTSLTLGAASNSYTAFVLNMEPGWPTLAQHSYPVSQAGVHH